MAMRIPRSVLVMSTITAVPFAVGVRAELHHAEPPAEMRVEALTAYEAQARADADALEAREHLARLDKLRGNKPAQLGSLFAGVEIGGPLFEDQRARLQHARVDGMRVLLEATRGVLESVAVTVDTRDCPTLASDLAAAWGRSTDKIWIDAANHRRAWVDAEACMVTFEHYVDAADWVAAQPWALIGTPPDTVPELGPGLEGGRALTYSITHVDERGRLDRIEQSVTSDFHTMIAVREAISRKLSLQPTRSADGVWLWKGHAMLAHVHDQRFQLTIGKQP